MLPNPRKLSVRRHSLLAVPVGEAREVRARSGRLPQKLTPARLLSDQGRGFVAGATLLERRGRATSSRTVALFALLPRTQLVSRLGNSHT